MKIAGIFLLSTVFAACAAFNVFSQPVKRVLWTDDKACRSMGFTDDERDKLMASCDSWITNDAAIQVIQINNFAVTVVMGVDGDYLLADTFVTNKADERLLVDPYQSTLFAWKTTDMSQTPEQLKPVSGEEIAAKLRNKANWINVIDAVLKSFATNRGNAEYRSAGSLSSFFSNGAYSGSTASTITTADLLAQVQQHVRQRSDQKGAYYVTNAMKANTVSGRSSANGIIFFKGKKAPAAVFTIRINDILFDFPSPPPIPSATASRSTAPAIPSPDPGFLLGNRSQVPTATPSQSVPPPVIPQVTPSPVSAPVIDTWKNAMGMEFVWAPPGEFQMGSADGESHEKPVRKVTITQGFWLGRYEITQLQWFTEMGTNPSGFDKCGGNCPVENVSWDDAERFILNLNLKNDGFIYSLPTEAQWEYAARAGTAGKTPGDLKEIGWYSENSGGRTQPVGTKLPNAFGLHDMHGNVWEWCLDWHGDYSPTPETDPLGPAKGKLRVLRGGAYNYAPEYVRSAYRGRLSPSTREKHVGLRVVARPR